MKLEHRAVELISLALIFFSSIAACSASDFSKLVWSDEFNAPAIDKTKWTLTTGDGCPNLCGFGNQELEWYQEQNAFISNGNLIIEARQEKVGGKDYTSAKLTTLGHQDWQYGKFEIRARLPEGQGLWPAIWLLPSGKNDWPTTGEIDMMEAKGNIPNEVHSTIHYGPTGNHQQQTQTKSNGNFQDGFHVFGCEWGPDSIKFSVDGQDFFETTKESVLKGNFVWPFDAKFYLILNVAVGGNFAGNPDSSTKFPTRMEVDYVRVYQ